MRDYYKFKYVCVNCKSIHWYLPKDKCCRKCNRDCLIQEPVQEESDMADDLDLSVDPHKLKDEWVRHVPMVFTWHKRLASAQSDLDVSKSNLDLKQAEVAGEIRDEPADYGIDGRVTNDAIEAALLQQPEIKAAIKAVNDCKAKVNKAQAAVSALVDRKKQLDMLTQLWIRDYYSDTEIPEDLDDDKPKRGKSR